MKTTFKLINIFVFILLVTTFSCSNDDDATAITISLQDLEVTIDENPTVGQVIGNIESNSTGSLTYTISSESPVGALSINSSGELTVVDETLFDFELNTSITATISATGASNTANVIINLNNLADVLVNYTETIQPDAAAGMDAFLGSSAPDNNYGSHPDFMSNRFTGGTVRSLIRFDFSNIPSNAIVNSVAVSFYSYQSPGNGNHFIGKGESYLQKVESAWDEATVTWNNQPMTSEVNQVLLENAQSNIQDYLDLDVTAIATEMINTPASNHGFMLKLVDETSTNNKLIFGSSDNTNSSLHPKVVVNYSVYE